MFCICLVLNPVGPIFEYKFSTFFSVDKTYTLRKTNAKFVDVIHVSTVLVTNDMDTGHLDVRLQDTDSILPSTLDHQAIIELIYISSLVECSQI